jgi:general secretion pathway protein E
VLDIRDLDTVLASGVPQLALGKEPFEFKSKSRLIDYLKRHAYEVKENALVRGRSGAEHSIDILAMRDDGIIIHHIAIGIKVSKKPIVLNKVFEFDDKAYDIGIRDKVFIAVPELTQEARQFAERQRIRVFEVKELEPSS